MAGVTLGQAFTVSLWLCTTARDPSLSALATDKDWDGGELVDATSHHDFGWTRTNGVERGWALALGADGAWVWNVGDGEHRLDFRPPAPAQLVADGAWHHLAFSLDPQAAEARLYRDGVDAAVYSLAELGQVRSGGEVTTAAPGLAQLADLRVEDGVVDGEEVARRWLTGPPPDVRSAAPARRTPGSSPDVTSQAATTSAPGPLPEEEPVAAGTQPPGTSSPAPELARAGAGSADAPTLAALARRGRSPTPVDHLRVMSWNIWHGGRRDGDEAGLQATIAAIRAADPDMVTMQETYGSGAHIAAGLGYHFYLRSSNLAVFSRFPVVATHDLFEPFRFGGVTLELSPGQRLRLFSLWIHYLPDYGSRLKDEATPLSADELVEAEMETRGREIGDIVALLDPFLRDSATVPVIVAGDFNSPSHLDWGADTAARHRGLIVDWPVSRTMAAAGFVDAFRAVHPDAAAAPGSTWSPRWRDAWQDRIDFVYLHGARLRIVGAEMRDEQAPRWPSDHAAVVVGVALATP